MARTCPACGRANDDDASFCQGCGASLAAAPPQAPPAPPGPPPGAGPPIAGPPRSGHTRGWVVFLVVAVIIAVAAVAALILLPSDETPDGATTSPTPSAGATVGVSPSPALGTFLAGAVGPKSDRLATITADGTVKPITRFSGQQIWQIAYSPDGKWLACAAGTFKRSELWLFDAATGAAGRRRRTRPTSSPSTASPGCRRRSCWWPGTRRRPRPPARTPTSSSTTPARSSSRRCCDSGGVSLRGVAVSASRDGATVAFVTYTDVRTGQYGQVTATERLELLDRATGAVTELDVSKAFFDVNARAFDEPLISPSGEAIIYRRAGSDVGTSYTVIGSDGTVLMPAKETQFPAGYAWDPEGTRVVFTGHSLKPAANASGIGPAIFWIFDTRSGSAQSVARYEETMVQDLSWSPDGSTIAWAEYEQERYQTGSVYLMPAGGGDSQTLVQEALSPVWAPDGAPSLQTSPSP